MIERCDVVVIGGGHAGTEAAALAARAGARTILLTQNLETIGQMSCNPAIGGIAKGTVVREVDALGGIMGRATDMARIQFRMLNRSKGPAVWSPRAQCDRALYRRAVRSLLERRPNLGLVQGTVAGLVVETGAVRGVETQDGRRYLAPAVVLTAGTFLRGVIHIGTDTRVPAGRAGDAPAVRLAQVIEQLGITVQRFKTGTPPRIDGRSVDFGRLTRQDGDPTPYCFSSYERLLHPAQRPCWLTWSGEQLRNIIESHLHHSALYGGAIAARGPRYCPSIEDKIVKFPEARRHQVFLEPEGLDTSEMYVNGLSTSLPAGVQLEFLHTLPGMHAVQMTRPGYAIEYDYFPPTQLRPTLELRDLPGLFLAGQVNGTTGYEEAAGQGAVAGLNAAAFALDREPVAISRSEAFIGVLVDDLVSRGVDEPYRLFTSRSEFRLSLRQDNALRRLFPVAERLGLLDDDERRVAEARLAGEDRVLDQAQALNLEPGVANPFLIAAQSTPVREPTRIADLARRPGVVLGGMLLVAGVKASEEDVHWADVEIKYSGYLAREKEDVRRLSGLEDLALPPDIPYSAFLGLSYEAREKLGRVRPASLAQASRIPGVSPSDIQNLVVELLRLRRLRNDVSRETSVEV